MTFIIAWLCALLPIDPNDNPNVLARSAHHRGSDGIAFAAMSFGRPGAERLICEWTMPRGSDPSMLASQLRLSPGSNWMKDITQDAIASTATSGALIIDARGWPFAALFAEADYQSKSILTGWSAPFGNKEPIAWYLENFAFPVKPHVPSFIADVGLHSAFLWLVAVAVVRSRKWLRTRRGQCPVCAYHLLGALANGCPECGWGREAAGRVARGQSMG